MKPIFKKKKFNYQTVVFSNNNFFMNSNYFCNKLQEHKHYLNFQTRTRISVKIIKYFVNVRNSEIRYRLPKVL